jgi:CelD/BcsL family acetyltransferase involved in cellulose biosynthesis
MAFIEAHPDATMFHHPAWMRMLSAVYGYRIFAVCARDGSTIRAGIPFADVRSPLTGNRWVSLPFADHCQPLLDPAHPAAGDEVIDHLKRSQGSETPAIVIHWDLPSSGRPLQQYGFVLHTLDLGDDESALFQSLDRGPRNNVRRAEREGVTVRECASWEECEAFYRLQVMTRRRLGVPVQPRALFRGVWHHIVEPGLGFVLLAYQDQTPIAGGVFFRFKAVLHYKYSAGDDKYRASQANAAVLWKALQQGIARGSRRLDFGRSATTDAGICEFKRRWGATETDLPYTVLAERVPANRAAQSSALVRSLIRHSPDFVCRWTGQLLYRHFA